MSTQHEITVAPLEAVNGLPFGASSMRVRAQIGMPDEALENYTGEWEWRYGDSFYRFVEDQLVEATFPATCRFVIDGVPVLSVYEWLARQPDAVDKAKFRISLELGLAWDNRFPEHGSLTAFTAGRWDALVLMDTRR